MNKEAIVPGAILLALACLLLTPARSEENPGRTALRLSPPDVRRLDEGSLWCSQVPEMEPVTEYGSFFGLKITLKLEGGWNTFSGDDIRKGIMGMYDNGVDFISASGVTNLSNERNASRGGLEVGGDLIYALTPRFGIGVGMAGITAWEESHLVYMQPPLVTGTFQSRPRVRVSTLRAGLFYSFPFAGRLAVSVRGGPAYYSVEYSCAEGCTGGFLRDGLTYTSYSQEARAKKWGAEGGLGLEFNPNRFVAIFLEVQGRYANISGLEGDETAAFYQDGQYRQSAGSGPVYLVETTANPQLDIIPSGGNVPGGAGRATLDFSGVTFLAGLKFRL